MVGNRHTDKESYKDRCHRDIKLGDKAWLEEREGYRTKEVRKTEEVMKRGDILLTVTTS